MIMNLFNLVTKAMDAAPYMAVSASFVWGILSVILSPCHLASIPLIVGFVGTQGDRITVKKAFLISLLFSLGILITIGIIGVITGLAGKMLGNTGPWGSIFVAVVLFITGLYLMDIVKLDYLNNVSQPKFERRGYVAALMLGLFFGLALGPCTFAYMAPVLAVAFKSASVNIMYSVTLVIAYALGHSGVIVLAGTFTDTVEKYLHWSGSSKGGLILKKICGVLVIAAGGYLIVGIIKQ
jgi:cytochrome c-type biogenesis protein